jgi:hypothetical protein
MSFLSFVVVMLRWHKSNSSLYRKILFAINRKNTPSLRTTYHVLKDHVTTKTLPTDPTWLRLDAMVLRWLYRSMSSDTVKLV